MMSKTTILLMMAMFQLLLWQKALANFTTVDDVAIDDCQPCNSKDDCENSFYKICLNRCCRDHPDYHCSDNGCQRKDCVQDPDRCLLQEPNRHCVVNLWNLNEGQCQCQDVEDPYTGSCRQSCKKSEDCQITDPNSHCNIYYCRCNTNFRRNHQTGRCEPFQCQRDDECWSENDRYRNCQNGTCVCEFDLDQTTQQCTIRFWSIFKLKYYRRAGQINKLLLLTIIIVPCVMYYCLVQNFRKARSTLISLNQQQQYPILRPVKMNDIIGQKEIRYQSMDMDKKKYHSSIGSDRNNENRKFKYERFQ